MKKKTIYTNQSQELLHLFEEAGNNSKIMCVPIDYAKKEHVVMFCNGYGDILRKPFSVKNSPEGIDYLTEQVRRSCLHRAIEHKHIFFGGEDVGSCSPAQSGIYRNLRNLVRHRASLVVMSTQVQNQIHTVVDRLFPGFLNEKKSGITPFSKSSMYLMENRFSAKQIRRRRGQKLTEILRRFGTSEPEKTAASLQEYAKGVLITPDEYIGTLQLSLTQHVNHIRCLQDNIEQLEREIAIWLAQTQGAFLTTVRGIGIVLAAGLTSEMGDPNEQKPVNNLVSYSGIIPRVKQTGGPEGKTYTGKVAKRCNRILKNYVVQSGLHLGLHGPDDLMNDYKRRDAAGQHADFGIARRYLRMAMCLMRTSQIYMPPGLRKKEVEPEQRAGYYLMAWPKLREKWDKLDALRAAFAKDQPLGRWRNMVQEIYGIKLTL
jgi:transposase